MDDFWDDLLSSWWGKILMSLVLFVLAWFIFQWFVEFESGEQSSRRVPWFVALAYYIGGKWTVGGVLGILGLLLGVSGIRQAITGKE